jgi:hypothetical protein
MTLSPRPLESDSMKIEGDNGRPMSWLTSNAAVCLEQLDEVALLQQPVDNSNTHLVSPPRCYRQVPLRTAPLPSAPHHSGQATHKPVPLRAPSQSVRTNTSFASSSITTPTRPKMTVVHMISNVLGLEPVDDSNAHADPLDEDGKFRVDPYHPLQSLLTHEFRKAKTGARKMVARAEEKMEKNLT